MANLKNKKTNAAKKPAAAAPVQSAASKDAAKEAETKVTEPKAMEVKAAPKAAEVEAAPKKEEVVSAKAAETKAAAEKKPEAKKTSEKKPAAKKPGRRAAKKTETVQEIFFEYAGEQILTEELVSRIKETYKSEGHRVGAIKSLRVYINPEDRRAYYVINDKAEGKYVEF